MQGDFKKKMMDGDMNSEICNNNEIGRFDGCRLSALITTLQHIIYSVLNHRDASYRPCVALCNVM